MKQVFLNVLVIAAFILLVQVSRAQIPQTMGYQGTLTDAGGATVSDGNYILTFRIYDAETGGSELWSETHASIAVVNGKFNVILGSVNPLSISFDIQLWLGISVNGGAELTPLIRLTSSPYSLNARGVLGDSNIFPPDDNVGIGTTTPETKLDVAGFIKVTGFKMLAGASEGYVLTCNDAGEGSWQPVSGNGGTTDGDWTLALPNMYSTPSGNVGIGTSTTGSKLHVVVESDVNRAGMFEVRGTGSVEPGIVVITKGYGSTTGYFINSGSGDDHLFESHAIHADISSDENIWNAVDATTAGTGNAGNFSSAQGNGVVGISHSDDPDSAGVRSIGNGSNESGVPGAAALNIYDGAITVAIGENIAYPAGQVEVSGTPIKFYTSNYSCTESHRHMVGYYINGTITNTLIVPNSIILLTVEFAGFSYDSRFAQVTSKTTGEADIRVVVLTQNEPTSISPEKVNYLIINPVSE